MALSDAKASAPVPAAFPPSPWLRQARLLALRQKVSVNIALATNDRAALARILRGAPSRDVLVAIAGFLEATDQRSCRKRFTQMKHLCLAAEAVGRHRKYLAAGKPARGLWKRAIGEVASRRKVTQRTVEAALQTHRRK